MRDMTDMTRRKADRRHTRRLHFATQPVALLFECLALLGLAALLYLSQVAAVASASEQLQAAQAQHSTLQRQDADLHARLGVVESPAYIDQQARRLGLAPSNPASAVVVPLPVPGSRP